MKKYILFVYTDEFVELELSIKHNLEFLSDCEIYFDKNIIDYSHDERIKIAVVGLSEEQFDKNGVTVIRDLSLFDMVLVYGREDVWKDITSVTQEISTLYNNHKICVLAGGIDYRIDSKEYFYPVLNHWKLTLLASNNNLYCQEHDRKFIFDALLGTPKSHRQYIFYRLLDDNLLDSSLVNITIDQDYYNDENHQGLWTDLSAQYRSKYGEVKPYRSEFLDIIDNEFEVDNTKKLEVDSLGNGLMATVLDFYNGTNVNVAHKYYHRAYITPYNVYKNSWYSILSETYQDYRFQPTEKTAKILLGGRIFVCFSCQYFLKNLRALGFKTFDLLIDESYDEVADTKTRFDMAWQQIKYLNDSDHQKNYEKVKDIIEYNRSLILNPQFQLDKIENFIYESIEKLSR